MPDTFVLRASYYKHSLTTRLNSVEIRQAFGKHSLAILDYQVRNRAQYTMPASETPVAIKWGRTPLGVRLFNGYVNHYDTEGGASDTTTAMYVLGTSKVFNTSTPTTWHQTTHSSIARDFAKRHRLRSVITPSKRILSAWSTGNRSDLLSFNALAAEIGYYPWIDGATVYFLNAKQVLRSAANMQTPRVTANRIRSVRVTGGRDAPRDESTPARRTALYGLDYRTNEFFTATAGSISNPTSTLGTPASTYAEALDVTAAASFQDEDYFSISCSMDGNAHVYPGSLVYMDSASVNRDQRGYWFVTDATHQVSADDFVTTWNGVRGTSSTPRTTQISTVAGAKRQAAAVIRRDNTWEAEVQEHVNA